MTARTGRRDVHIHLYLDDPDERRAYEYLQKRKNSRRHWIADAINAYADGQKKNAAADSRNAAAVAEAVRERLDAIEKRLAAIEQELKRRASQTAAQQTPSGRVPHDPDTGGGAAGTYKSGAGFSDADLEAEAAQIPRDVFDSFKVFTG